MLNAFRHQRIDHPVWARPGGRLADRCSTPFGINESTTASRACLKQTARDVLNAFRHQRIDHHRRDATGASGIRVLNAFRHQRIDHVTAVCLKLTGIQVLNAFRHQRIDHNAPLTMKAIGERCSTPFGINESTTG